MAKNFTIDYATGELDMGADTLREKFDLDEVTFRQPNLGQRFNLGGRVEVMQQVLFKQNSLLKQETMLIIL